MDGPGGCRCRAGAVDRALLARTVVVLGRSGRQSQREAEASGPRSRCRGRGHLRALCEAWRRGRSLHTIGGYDAGDAVAGDPFRRCRGGGGLDGREPVGGVDQPHNPARGGLSQAPDDGVGLGADVWVCRLCLSGGNGDPHAEAARDLRYAAGGVFVVTLASLPMLGAGRRRGRPADSPGRAS